MQCGGVLVQEPRQVAVGRPCKVPVCFSRDCRKVVTNPSLQRCRRTYIIHFSTFFLCLSCFHSYESYFLKGSLKKLRDLCQLQLNLVGSYKLDNFLSQSFAQVQQNQKDPIRKDISYGFHVTGVCSKRFSNLKLLMVKKLSFRDRGGIFYNIICKSKFRQQDICSNLSIFFGQCYRTTFLDFF